MQKETCGIYVISERATQRAIYVGQSIGIEGRWPRHWKRFPQERFDYRIIQECPPAELNFWEKYYIRVLKTHWTEAGENQNWGGQHWPKPEEPLSPATRAKISRELKGRTISEEHRAKLSEVMTGKTRSEEARAKISATQKGRTLSEEHRAKISAANRGRVPHNKGNHSPNKGKVQSEDESATRRGRVSPNKGKPMSEEQKMKISAANKGKVQSEETKAKRRGKTHSEEAKAKMSAVLKGKPSPTKGKPMSEEQKAKLSASAKARLALKRAAKAAAVAALEALLTAEIISTSE